jgi:hypothetical protein
MFIIKFDVKYSKVKQCNGDLEVLMGVSDSITAEPPRNLGSSILNVLVKMEAENSSKTLVTTYCTTRVHVDPNLPEASG